MQCDLQMTKASMTENDSTHSSTSSPSNHTSEEGVPNKGVSNDDASNPRSGTGILAVMQSVGAAMLGVQSSKNKERDFTHGKPLHFIIGGLIGTLIFLLLIGLLVKYLIATN